MVLNALVDSLLPQSEKVGLKGLKRSCFLVTIMSLSMTAYWTVSEFCLCWFQPCFDLFSMVQPGSHEQSFYSPVCTADGSTIADPSCASSQPVTSQPTSGYQKSFSEHSKPCKEPELVLIAELTSRQEIKFRIKQNDEIAGAKVSLWQSCM